MSIRQQTLDLFKPGVVLKTSQVASALNISHGTADTSLRDLLCLGEIDRLCGGRDAPPGRKQNHYGLPGTPLPPLGSETRAPNDAGVWNEKLVKELRALKAAGKSNTAIAHALGHGITKNAVIGKALRLGIKGPGRASAPPKPARSATVVRALKAPAVKKLHPNTLNGSKPPAPTCGPLVLGPGIGTGSKPPEKIELRAEAAGAVTVLTIGPSMCRWPIGDPQSDDFTMCGGRSPDGPYCARHSRMAYQPQSAAAKKRNSASEMIRSARRYA